MLEVGFGVDEVGLGVDEVGFGVEVGDFVVEEDVEVELDEDFDVDEELLDDVELDEELLGERVVVGWGDGAWVVVIGAGASVGGSVCGRYLTLPAGGSRLTGSPSSAPIM